MAVQTPPESGRTKRDKTHYLYIAVIGAVLAGILVGFVAPGVATELKPLGTGFVNLIKMMISPIIFCTIVLGVGSVRKAAKVGAVGGLALGYFMVMSTVALAIGIVVANLLPAVDLNLTEAAASTGAAQAGGEAETTVEFLVGIIPTTLVSAFTEGEVLQTLLVALLVGFALQAMGTAGEPVLRGIGHIQRLVFKVLAMIMWAAPVGAFGAIAAVVGETGLDALKSLAVIMIGFYVTCVLFVFVVLGTLLRLVAGVNIFSLLKYLGREFLLILSTSSSETALPRSIAPSSTRNPAPRAATSPSSTYAVMRSSLSSCSHQPQPPSPCWNRYRRWRPAPTISGKAASSAGLGAPRPRRAPAATTAGRKRDRVCSTHPYG